jgi:hypothetical protein
MKKIHIFLFVVCFGMSISAMNNQNFTHLTQTGLSQRKQDEVTEMARIQNGFKDVAGLNHGSDTDLLISDLRTFLNLANNTVIQSALTTRLLNGLNGPIFTAEDVSIAGEDSLEILDSAHRAYKKVKPAIDRIENVVWWSGYLSCAKTVVAGALLYNGASWLTGFLSE